MKKIVLKLDLHDNKDKRKALKSVSTFSGIDSIAIDMNERKLTVVGAVDPVDLVTKLRKSWPSEILSVAAPPQGGGGGGGGGGAGMKKEGVGGGSGVAGGGVKNNPSADQLAEMVKAYQGYYYNAPPAYAPPNPYQYYHVRNVDEEPISCVIC